MAFFTILVFQKLPKLGPEFMYVKREPLLPGTSAGYFIIFIVWKRWKIQVDQKISIAYTTNSVLSLLNIKKEYSFSSVW